MSSIEGDYYEPGDPHSFGRPPKPLSGEDLDAFQEDAQYYLTHPDAFLRLLHGQDEGMQRSIGIIKRDHFLSAFPEIAEGVDFVFQYLPLIMSEYGLDQDSLKTVEELTLFYDEILANFYAEEGQIRGGGLETNYIYFERPPQEQSYEYIGERIGRSIRRYFHQDRSYKTQAFFGWLGRQVMKKNCPETDFSFDRHAKMAAEEKAEELAKLREIKSRIEKGLEGEISLEKCYNFFRDFHWQLPSLDCAETPLQYQLASKISDAIINLPDHPDDTHNFEHFYREWQEAARKGIPELIIQLPWEKEFQREEGVVSYETWMTDLQRFISRSRKIDPRDRNFYDGLVWMLREHGIDDPAELPQDEVMAWYEKVETRHQRRWANSHLYYWRQDDACVFGNLVFDLEKMSAATQEELLPLWFKMHCRDFLRSLEWVIEETEAFETTYFRFIDIRSVAEGYALAQAQIEEIMAHLPEIVRLPEAEVHHRFLLAEPRILSDKQDYGENSGDDLYKGRFDRHPFDFDEHANLSEEDQHWLVLIEGGPNASLFENLKFFEFTSEQWVLGVHPLFYGFDYSDREADAFLSGDYQEFLDEQRALTAFRCEERRISELKAGDFSLPKNMEDLLANLDLHRKRLLPKKNNPQVSRRLMALQQVEEILREIQEKGLLKEPGD